MRNKNLKKLIINASSNWVALIINICIGFFLTPYIIATIGKGGYGIWTLISSIVGYYGVLNLGIDAAVLVYLTKLRTKNDILGMNRVYNTSLISLFFIGLIIIISSYIFNNKICELFKLEKSFFENFTVLFKVMSFSVLFTLMSAVFSASLRSKEYYALNSIINIVSNLIRMILTVIFIKNGFGVIGLGYANIISMTASMFFNYSFMRILYSELRFNVKYIDRKYFKMLIIYGLFSTIITVGNILRTSIDSFVIGKYINVEYVGIYGVAGILVKYFSSIVNSAAGVLTPRFTMLNYENEKSELINLFIKSLYASAFISFCIGTVIFLIGEMFIKIWVGADFFFSGKILLLLVVPWTFELAQNPCIGYLYSINKHKYYAILNISEGLLNLLLSICLVKRFGLLGVAWGTVVSMLLFKIIIQPILVVKITGIQISRYIKPIFIFTLLSLLIIILNLIKSNVFNKVEYGLVGILIYGLIIFLGFCSCSLLLLKILSRTEAERANNLK